MASVMPLEKRYPVTGMRKSRLNAAHVRMAIFRSCSLRSAVAHSAPMSTAGITIDLKISPLIGLSLQSAPSQ